MRRMLQKPWKYRSSSFVPGKSAIDRKWNRYIAGLSIYRPPLTCIVVGGIEKEKEFIKWLDSAKTTAKII